MGCASSKSVPPQVGDKVEMQITASMRVPLSTRKNLVFLRDNVTLEELYDVVKIIGQGSMGEVSIVRKKQNAVDKLAQHIDDDTKALSDDEQSSTAVKTKKKRRRKYASKTINTVQFSDSEILEFINEIEILRELDHPNIVQLFEVLRMKRKMWIITELCTGGDLTSRMQFMTEPHAAQVVQQILRAVTYMHSQNVCHRDIKLENVLYADSSADAPVKLIDFGLSDKFTKGEKMRKTCGTVYTAAPEIILGQGYTEQTDIWSVGCVAFILLSGDYPFIRDLEDLLDDQIMNKLKNASFSFGTNWEQRRISKLAREFVTACLQKEAADRWSAKEALDFCAQKWIPHLDTLSQVSPDASTAETGSESKEQSETQPRTSKKKRVRMNTSMVKGMGKFVLYGELKKTILMTMAYTMDKSSLRELREIFMELDSTGSGTVSLIDLEKALKRMHSDKNMDDATIEKLFHGIDADESGQIHYMEFLAAVVESQGLITMEHLADAFDRLDVDGKGYITREDLKNLLGTDYNEEKVNRMIDEADSNKNGQVDYDEFLRLMFAQDPGSGLEVLGTNIVSGTDTKMVEKMAQLGPSREIHNLETQSSL